MSGIPPALSTVVAAASPSRSAFSENSGGCRIEQKRCPKTRENRPRKSLETNGGTDEMSSAMIRLRSTLSRLQEPGNVFVSPWRTLTGPDLHPVQLLGDLPERLAALPEPVNPLQDGLLARLRLHVALVGRLPETIRRVADELQLRLLVAHRVPRPLSDGLPLPLTDRDHDVQDQPAGGAACVQRLGDRYQRDAPALELLQQDGQVSYRTGQPVQLGDDDHAHGPRLHHFEDADHAGPVEILGALTGVNEHVQKFDVMDGRHC